jgi:hypothetical protein
VVPTVKVTKISKKVQERRQWFGHVERRDEALFVGKRVK